MTWLDTVLKQSWTILFFFFLRVSIYCRIIYYIFRPKYEIRLSVERKQIALYFYSLKPLTVSRKTSILSVLCPRAWLALSRRCRQHRPLLKMQFLKCSHCLTSFLDPFFWLGPRRKGGRWGRRWRQQVRDQPGLWNCPEEELECQLWGEKPRQIFFFFFWKVTRSANAMAANTVRCQCQQLWTQKWLIWLWTVYGVSSDRNTQMEDPPPLKKNLKKERRLRSCFGLSYSNLKCIYILFFGGGKCSCC